MKKFFTIFFVTLGVIFLCVILYIVYLWNLHPNELKTFLDEPQTKHIEISNSSESNPKANSTTTSGDTTDKNPNLTAGQEDALELIGIDPAAIPQEITPEQYACFVSKLGEARVLEIKAGAAPEVLEIFKTKECLN